jgi:hypothetical protein
MTRDLPGEYTALEERVLGAMREDLSDAEFDEAALAVWRFQREWNVPYGNFCRARAEPRSWREIPAVPQGIFKRYTLSVFPEALIQKTFRTSGTTGEGFGEHHFHTTRLYEEAVIRGWRRLALPTCRQVILAQPPGAAPHSSLSHMFGTLAAFGSQQYCVGADGALDQAALREALAASEPVALLGTALAFLHLFERGERFPLARGSFALETGGYKGSGRELSKADLYESFEARLGLEPDAVWNEYGMTELSSQCYTRGLGAPHEAPPWVRAVVIDPESGGEVALGQTGVLRLFDLANLGSVLCVQTQDLAVRRKSGFELIGRDPAALPRGCSRTADEALSRANT